MFFNINKTCIFLHVQLDPKRLKKKLPESLKLIKGEDRVLVIGTTRDPHSADVESLCKMYTKILLIPRPDYSSRYGTNTDTRSSSVRIRIPSVF